MVAEWIWANPSIYNKGDPKHKDRRKRARLFHEKAEQLGGLQAKDLQTWYATQRNSYGKLVRRATRPQLFNKDTETTEDSDGNEIVRQIYVLKSSKTVDLANNKKPAETRHSYRDHLMWKIIHCRRDTTISMNNSTSRLIFPHVRCNITTIDKPPLSTKYNRAQNYR